MNQLSGLRFGFFPLSSPPGLFSSSSEAQEFSWNSFSEGGDRHVDRRRESPPLLVLPSSAASAPALVRDGASLRRALGKGAPGEWEVRGAKNGSASHWMGSLPSLRLLLRWGTAKREAYGQVQHPRQTQATGC